MTIEEAYDYAITIARNRHARLFYQCRAYRLECVMDGVIRYLFKLDYGRSDSEIKLAIFKRIRGAEVDFVRHELGDIRKGGRTRHKLRSLSGPHYRDPGPNILELCDELDRILDIVEANEVERSVICLIVKGLSGGDIASKLQLTPSRISQIITGLKFRIFINYKRRD